MTAKIAMAPVLSSLQREGANAEARANTIMIVEVMLNARSSPNFVVGEFNGGGG